MRFFIPYGGREDWGEELKYALRSLDVLDPDVDIYATKLPNWLMGGRTADRFYPKGLDVVYGCRKYEHWFDSMNKLRIYANETTEESFIYSYDDILLVGDFRIIHYPQEKVLPKHKVRFSRYRHGETILSALAKCARPYYNYETHTPRIYETEKLRHLFKSFPLEKERVPYSIATLYFNYFGNDVEQEIIKTDDYKAGFYGKPGQGNGYSVSSLSEIDEIVKDKVWLNYSYAGLMQRTNDIPLLLEWIKQRFNKKSKYESSPDNNK